MWRFRDMAATTSAQIKALQTADVALGARIDKEVQARVVGDTALAGRISILESQVKLLIAASGGGGGTTPEPPNTPPANEAPVISGVTITVTGQTTATIAWTTNEAATGYVQYGTTIAYGSQTASTSSGTTHSRNLTSLTAGTTYHARVRATDGTLERIDADRTFTTQGTVVPPDPGDPPPPLTGVVIGPGTGTIAAAIANGDRNLILRGGTYKDSFGSTQRTDTVTLRNYPGETPVIDGTGLLQNFVYLSTGNWSLIGVRLQGFRANGSGVIGNNNGTLLLEAVTGVGLGAADQQSQYVYAFGNGTTTIKNGTRIFNAPGAALQLYSNGAASPVVNVFDSELEGQHRGVYAYDGTLNATRTEILATGTVIDMEKTADCTVNMTNCFGGGSGTPPAVRVVNV